MSFFGLSPKIYLHLPEGLRGKKNMPIEATTIRGLVASGDTLDKQQLGPLLLSLGIMDARNEENLNDIVLAKTGKTTNEIKIDTGINPGLEWASCSDSFAFVIQTLWPDLVRSKEDLLSVVTWLLERGWKYLSKVDNIILCEEILGHLEDAKRIR